MKTRQDIKELARMAMREQRGTAILLIFFVGLMGFISSRIDSVVEQTLGRGVAYFLVYTAGWLVILIMNVNMIGEFIKIWKKEPAKAEVVFTGLGENFWRKLGGVCWIMLWLAIWAAVFLGPVAILSHVFDSDGMLILLFPLSGFVIAKIFAYFFTYNILADCPQVKATQALKVSMKITNGHKGEIFVFVLSFIGWLILPGIPPLILYWAGVRHEIVQVFSVFASGLFYIVFTGPYFYTADAGLYLELRDKALRDGKITHEELGLPEPYAVHDPMVIH